jgi:hypothetical protein
MGNLFRDQSEETKVAHAVTEDANDETWLYCTACERAVRQGDCLPSEVVGGTLRCPFDDCVPDGNLAFQSLYGWDAYRLEHGHETADWPEEPTAGGCYRLADR